MTEPHLPAWVRNPALEACWARVRSRFEASGLVAQGRTIVELSTREERHAVGELLGRVLTRDRVSVDLAELDDRLRQRSGAGGLADLLPVVTGAPLLDRPADRAEQMARREGPVELARTLVVEPWAEGWVAGLRATGLLTNRDDASLVVQQAAAVLSALAAGEPVEPGTRSRVELAAQIVGDAHALDEDRVLTQVVLRGLAAASGRAVPGTHAERRALWEAYAVAPDLLSRTCLTVGLRPTSDDPVARRLQLAAAAGDPMHLTGWDLRRLAGGWQSGPGQVLVCENPRVLEAIAEKYAGNHAVVCTSGEPNTVVTALLQRLVDAGCPLRYHGDFDWPGIAIANRILTRFGAIPWRMNAVDYERAARADGPALQGTAVEPCWDAELGAGMRAAGRAVHEESVLPDLLEALA